MKKLIINKWVTFTLILVLTSVTAQIQKPLCKDSEWQCHDGSCIKLKLKCDSDPDCPDGSDEFESTCAPPTPAPLKQESLCGKNQFQCDDGTCIKAKLMCDTDPDCPDESDENPVLCEGTQAPVVTTTTTTTTTTPKPACPPNQFQCGTDGPCLKNKLRCDEDIDCPNGEDEDPAFCASNLITGPSPKILFTMNSSVQMVSLDTGNTEIIRDSEGQPIGVTFDAARQVIYWTDTTDQHEAIYSANMNGSDKKVVVDTGVVLPEGIAFDWVAGNIYFTDSNLTHIGVCDKDGNACTIVIQEKIDKPRKIVLHPSQGKMFWSDWGIMPSIMSAGMDGSTPLAIVTKDLKWPNGLAIDHGNSRLYWADALNDFIETTKLDGSDRRIIRTTGVRHPFSMDIFGDTIYWSDWVLQQVQSCNKFTGNNHSIIYSSALYKIYGVTVYHPAAQQQNIQNPCANKPCSHICVLTPAKSYRCLCPVGMNLKSDTKTCQDDPKKAKLFIAQRKTVKQMHFQSIGNSVLFGNTIDELENIGSVVYNPINKTFILFDTFRKNFFTYNSTNSQLEVLVSQHLEAVKGIDIDLVSQNLYWVDAGKKTLEVMSLQTRTRATLLHFDEFRPTDIVVVQQIHSMFVALAGPGEGQIMKLSMDARDIHILVTIPDGEPTGLAYQEERDHIFWCDARRGTIEHVGLEGGVRYIAVAKANKPFSIALNANRLYWTDLNQPVLNSILLSTSVRDSPIFIGDHKMPSDGSNNSVNFFAYLGVMENDLSVMQDIQNMIDSHECGVKSGKKPLCSHMCLLSSEDDTGTCVCPDNMQLDDDDHNCIPLLGGCFQDQFTCSDGSCISEDSFCDQFKDCPNGEDEQNCTSSSSPCRISDFVCKSDQSCIAGTWRCDGEADCHDASDEVDCPKKPCPNANDFMCALGSCIPQSWRCDHIIDCPGSDHSDEDGCNFNCAEGEFECGAAGGHDCITNRWVCDGEPDCVDGSDEHHCSTECNKNEFRCKNHRCIRQQLVCNGRDDCQDNSDEEQCTSVGGRSSSSKSKSNNSTTLVPKFVPRLEIHCSSDEYWCLSGECVPYDRVCNGQTDCFDGSDEGGRCDEVCGFANESSYKCNKTPKGSVCSCPVSYRLSSEHLKSCEDIDEYGKSM